MSRWSFSRVNIYKVEFTNAAVYIYYIYEIYIINIKIFSFLLSTIRENAPHLSSVTMG